MTTSYTHENAVDSLGLDESQVKRYGDGTISMNLASTTDAARRLRKSTRRVYDLCATGSFVGAHKLRGTWRIPLPLIIKRGPK